MICESFLEIMHQKSYDKITITEVCNNANLVRETFYRNFSSKDAVLKRILDIKFNELEKLAQKNIKEPSIELFFINYFAYWESQKEFLNLLINNHLFSIMHNKTIELIYIKLDATIKETETNKTKNYIASIYSGAINNLLFAWAKNEFEETPQEITRILKSYSIFF